MAKTITRRSGELNIEIEKGSVFRHTLTWKTVAQDGTEELVDLTNCTAEMQIRETQLSDTVLFRLATADTHVEGDGLITLGDAAGTIELHIADSLSELWTWERGVYSIEITLANLDVHRLLRGSFRAFDETTR